LLGSEGDWSFPPPAKTRHGIARKVNIVPNSRFRILPLLKTKPIAMSLHVAYLARPVSRRYHPFINFNACSCIGPMTVHFLREKHRPASYSSVHQIRLQTSRPGSNGITWAKFGKFFRSDRKTDSHASITYRDWIMEGLQNVGLSGKGVQQRWSCAFLCRSGQCCIIEAPQQSHQVLAKVKNTSTSSIESSENLRIGQPDDFRKQPLHWDSPGPNPLKYCNA
jgi:hypothetical protein